MAQHHTLYCRDCGSDDFTYSGGLTDATPVFCGSCSRLFGSYGVIQQAMQKPITNPLRIDHAKDLSGAKFNLRQG